MENFEITLTDTDGNEFHCIEVFYSLEDNVTRIHDKELTSQIGKILLDAIRDAQDEHLTSKETH